MLVNSIFSFSPQSFLLLSKTEIIMYVTFILSSAHAFNLYKVKVLSSGKGLMPFDQIVQVTPGGYSVIWSNFLTWSCGWGVHHLIDIQQLAFFVPCNFILFLIFLSKVEALKDHRVVDVACGSGDAQTLCITDNDCVWSWGDGDYGKLGKNSALAWVSKLSFKH